MINPHLHELYIDMLKDLHSAEDMIVNEGLPAMIKAAKNPELKRGFEEHLVQSKTHVTRLEQIAKSQGISFGGKKCPAMEGIITEAKELMSMKLEGNASDFALIAAAQKVEHYEMSSYSSAIMLAELMEHDVDIDLLEETLDEEVETSQTLDEVVEDLLIELDDREADDVDEEEDLEE